MSIYGLSKIRFVCCNYHGIAKNSKEKNLLLFSEKKSQTDLLYCAWTQEVTMWNFIDEHTNTRKKMEIEKGRTYIPFVYQTDTFQKLQAYDCSFGENIILSQANGM